METLAVGIIIGLVLLGGAIHNGLREIARAINPKYEEEYEDA